MKSWHEFITMGGYGLYVWPAYALGLIVIAFNVVAPILARRRLLRRIEIERALAEQSTTARQTGQGDDTQA
ncbi:heme exporter protein CcmD [Salinisphaera sp. SWV1]|uniref:heme exporter protein CcmD n=1 Tax=Salinisphaera sp. SWV1 TaxID=3454139 RepID=UPI003F840E1A